MPIEPSLVSSLTWFAHIARNRSFTKAATEIEVARAALSQQLKGLEHVTLSFTAKKASHVPPRRPLGHIR
jgi:hypothetical protein